MGTRRSALRIPDHAAREISKDTSKRVVNDSHFYCGIFISEVHLS